MRRALLLLLLTFLGACTAQDGSAHAVLRQANAVLGDAGTRWTGTTMGAHLGAVIASCPGGGFVGGAPGNDTVLFIPQGVRVSGTRPTTTGPFPLVCIDSGNLVSALVGGPSAQRMWLDGVVQSTTVNSIDALALSGDFLAVGRVNAGSFSLFTPTATSLGLPVFSSAAVTGNGSALAWQTSDLLAVANASTHTVTLWTLVAVPDGGVLATVSGYLPNPDPTMGASDFGAVLASGNVMPSAGDELIVAAPALGRVYIFSGGGLVMTLSRAPSFGASVVVDPREFGGGLHALWIGEPNAEAVHYFMGDAGTEFASPGDPGARFGAAIAVDSNGVLAVGAPLFSLNPYDQKGAIYSGPTDAGVLQGAAVSCSANQDCMLAGCTPGTCIGGVFCQQAGSSGSACSVGRVCVNNGCVAVDAGTLDAGRLDAGVDAGEPDAGPEDAGGSDAGPEDAGSSDGGKGEDAGSPDAGSAQKDGGSPDAGEKKDAGSLDGGDQRDGGAGEVVTFTTCGCTSGGLPLLLLGLLLVRRRR